MRLRHIEVFNAVMRTGSVSAAARTLNVTQPAVSRTLQHAELQLGFALFARTAGRLQPTPEALALHPHIERLFDQLDDVQRLAAGLKAGRGVLRVLTVPSLGHEIFPRAMQLFRARHPDVLVQHQALHTPQIISALVLQEADVGYTLHAASHPALAQERLAERRLMCVAPKGMLDAATLQGQAVELPALAGLPLIALDGRDPLGMVLEHALGEQAAPLVPVVTVQTYHVALALAQHGMGVALVDGCTAASADRTRVDVLPVVPAITTGVHALRAAQRAQPLTVRAFTRSLQQALQQVGAA